MFNIVDIKTPKELLKFVNDAINKYEYFNSFKDNVYFAISVFYWLNILKLPQLDKEKRWKDIIKMLMYPII